MAPTLRRGAVVSATAAVTLAVAGLSPALAQAAGPSPRTTLDDAPAWTTHAVRVGQTPAGQLQHLTAVLALRDPAGAESLAAAVSDPASAQYGAFVTPAQWRARFAPRASDVAAVTAWLRAAGFTVGAIPANHRTISFSGTTAQVEKAFGTDLQTFRRSGSTVSANASSVSVPRALAGTVVGISGLDTSALRRPDHTGGPDPSPAGPATATTAAPTSAAAPADTLPPPGPVFRNATPCSAYYGQKAATSVPQILTDPLTYAPCGYKPGQIRGAYGVDDALSAGYDGRGATIAILDAFASPTIFSDAQTYARRNDPRHPLRHSQFAQSLPASYSFVDECDAAGWYGEETLDVEAAHATAPQAHLLYVGASSCQDADLNEAMNTVVDNGLAQVISNSYGSSGEPSSPTDVADEHQTFLQAAAQGISVLFSSGDNGDELAATGKRQVDYPAADPWVTAVGGTALAVTKDDGYGFEQGWGTGKSVLTQGAWSPSRPAYLYGGGGGTSRLFTQPRYQKDVVPASIADFFGQGPHRAVPDVAMLADPNTGFLVGQSQTFPDNTVRYSEYRIGGTSLSCPLFAGVVAVTNQLHGGPLGFVNPRLYSLAGTSAFHDVDHGRKVTTGVVRVDFVNGVDDKAGLTTSLRTLGQTGTLYTRKGYDDVTGIGTPNGASFFTAVAGARMRH